MEYDRFDLRCGHARRGLGTRGVESKKFVYLPLAAGIGIRRVLRTPHPSPKVRQREKEYEESEKLASRI